MELPRDRRGWAKLALALVGLFVAYQVGKRALPDIDVQQVLEDVAVALGAWTYPLVGLLAFLETGAFVGLLAPGETFVVLAGAVAGQGATSVTLTIGIVWLCAFLGDTASYVLGVKLGRGFVLEHGARVRITRERFAQVESYFARHGGKTILIGRFIGLVRALAPFIAGSSGMRYRALAPYSVLGTGIWATTFTLLGFYFSRSVDVVLSNAEHVLLAFGILVGLTVAIVVAARWLRVPENRERATAELESRPAGRRLLAVGRRLSPQARFLADRLTPGGAGLEVTTALAALAVGSYVLVAYGLTVTDFPGPTTGDSTAADLAGHLRAGWLTELAEVVTALGSTLATAAVTLAAAVWLALRRHWGELIVLVAGVLVILLGTQLAKEIVARPRPLDGLVGADGFSYPSGHASHSVVYLWLALTLALRLRPGMPRATLLIVAGVLLTAAIGLSRVYLGVHYLSDVNGGWALGASAFSLLAAIALIVGHIRHNGDEDVP